MVRTDDEAERQALKEEIKGELRTEAARRKAMGCGTCLVLTLVAVAVPALLVLSMFARTGFVDVPLLSGWLYRPTEPVRIVRPLTGSTQEQVLQAVTSKVKYDPAVSTLAISISETQATTLAQGLLENAENLPFSASSVQVAMEKDFVEFYFVSVRPKRNATVRVRLVPEVSRDRIVLNVKELRIGSLAVPHAISKYMVTVFGLATEKALNDFAAQVGRLRDFSLNKGGITATIRTASP